MEDLPLEEILSRFKAVLFDVDNTVVPHHGTKMPTPVWEWMRSLIKSGIVVALASNATQERVHKLETLFSTEAFVAMKPFPWRIRQWLRTHGLQPKEVLLVGDQVMTDHLATLTTGISSALVDPLTKRDFILTQWISRPIERLIMKGWRGREEKG